LDLLITRGGAKYGFEFKFAEAPATTKSMRVAKADLNLKRLFVVYPGTRRFELDDDIIALPLTGLLDESQACDCGRQANGVATPKRSSTILDNALIGPAPHYIRTLWTCNDRAL